MISIFLLIKTKKMKIISTFAAYCKFCSAHYATENTYLSSFTTCALIKWSAIATTKTVADNGLYKIKALRFRIELVENWNPTNVHHILTCLKVSLLCGRQ